ncbi:hypothetical protein BTA51_10330 [Hahella sp. CCB-MM4]|uniref:hypothetical protein n=1 Tax=Hahella sp. (strain CCB-MM4) TaxID=1926491 RepID=UPI000B9A8F80|nr:hypothetical protein [Hahella sp. CCB-MM4]OZG73416.1 hypothetical protein BTA51_10330 [Hahella sp. CCB-MM4]
MESNKQDNIAESALGKSSRRQFLQRASAGAVLATIPTKSVWAGGGGITQSIVASGHGSDWADGITIQLRSPGYWKNHFPSNEKNLSFKSVFGCEPLSENNFSGFCKIKSNDNYYFDLTLFDIAKDAEGDSGAVVDNSSTDLDGSQNPDFLKTKDGDNYFDLSGPHNVNRYMVCMYMNALYHGTRGIYYPITNVFGTVDAFAQYLCEKALISSYELASSLEYIIQNCDVGTNTCNVS